MNKLRASDSADAIVDGLRQRRAEVYVPSSLRPLNVLDLALPRGIKPIASARSAATRSPKSSTRRLARTNQEATRRPLTEPVGRSRARARPLGPTSPAEPRRRGRMPSTRARPLPRSPKGTAIDRRFVHSGQPHCSRARGACAARPRAIARSATKAAGGEAKAGGATSA